MICAERLQRVDVPVVLRAAVAERRDDGAGVGLKQERQRMEPEFARKLPARIEAAIGTQ
jgi:hypothetical protein